MGYPCDNILLLAIGIPAIVFAAKVNGKLGAGDYGGAMEASKTAAMWCWIAFGLGLLAQGIYWAFIIFGMIAGGEFNGY